jgi:hypothetical protein
MLPTVFVDIFQIYYQYFMKLLLIFFRQHFLKLWSIFFRNGWSNIFSPSSPSPAWRLTSPRLEAAVGGEPNQGQGAPALGRGRAGAGCVGVRLGAAVGVDAGRVRQRQARAGGARTGVATRTAEPRFGLSGVRRQWPAAGVDHDRRRVEEHVRRRRRTG